MKSSLAVDKQGVLQELVACASDPASGARELV